MLFLSLGVLLIFSSGLILYGSLFTAPETAFLLSPPARADQVFAYKFQAAVGLSSWAFLLLGRPIVLVAYGLVCQVPWYFYVLLPLFFLGFVLVPGRVGALCCVLLVVQSCRKQPRSAVRRWALLLLSAGAWRWCISSDRRLASSDAERVTRSSQLLGTLLRPQPSLPSHWVTQRAAGGAAGASGRRPLYYLALMWSNGLLLYLA